METNSREERLKKLKELQNNITQKGALPTIRKEDLVLSDCSSKINSLKASTTPETLTERINKVSTSISTLRESKEKLLQYSKNQVEIVIIIDKSGSVLGTEQTVSNGIYNLTVRQKEKNRNEIITTVLFDTEMRKIHDRLPIEYVNRFDYQADGGTALYDSLVKQIIETKEKQAKDINKPKKTIVVISTDGKDEHSKKYNSYDVKNLIKERSEDGWEFIFLGTNFDVKDEAMRLGIKEANAVEYNPLRLTDNFLAIENALDDVYDRGEITKEWSKPITEHNQLSSGAAKTYTKKLLG